MSNFSYEKYKDIVGRIREQLEVLEGANKDNYKSFEIEDSSCQLISKSNSLRMYIMHSNKR